MLWCTSTDIDNVFNLGVSESPVRPPFNSLVVNAMISMASSVVESRLATRYVIPASIDDIPDEIELVAATIAGYNLIVWRGNKNIGKNSDVDMIYKERYDWAMQELDDIAENRVHPQLKLVDNAIPLNWGAATQPGGTMLSSGVGCSSARSYNRGWVR
jgi:hypothetical protein